MPRARALAFSRQLWTCNLEFFDAVAAAGPPVRVADTNPGFQALAARVGAAPNAPMSTLCRWHLDRLPT